MSNGRSLDNQLSEKTSIVGLRLWVVIGISVGAFTVVILLLLSLWLSSRNRSKKLSEKMPSILIPAECKEIKEVVVDHAEDHPDLGRTRRGHMLSASEISDAEKEVVTFGYNADADGLIPSFEIIKGKPAAGKDPSCKEHGKLNQWPTRAEGDQSKLDGCGMVNSIVAVEGEKRGIVASNAPGKSPTESGGSHSGEYSSSSSTALLPTTVPEVSHLGWGQWYTLRELEQATNHFASGNVLGEGGYGIVYQGKLPDGSLVAVKNLLNNRGQAEKEFRVEVEAIGRVRHKNLVRLQGYCAEGSHRMLVFEYVNNGNLEQWLHGTLGEKNPVAWEARMKIVLGMAKGLAYLHEGLEPKVVHRDVKSSNILLDTEWNAKVSDFGLAKLLGAGKTHVVTRVMGTFGYVAPEYASSGMLTESSDVYSFGVLMMEIITGRDPVDYSRPNGEMNLVDWLKTMVASRQSDDVVDPRMAVKPSARALKRALLVALRCVDPDALKRPKMSHVVYMLEADDFPFREVSKPPPRAPLPPVRL